MVDIEAYWPGVAWPTESRPWPGLDGADADDYGSSDSDLKVYCASKSWAWGGQRVYFLCDIHGDADAFFLSLVGAGGIVKTGAGDGDFELTDQGRTAKFIIGGDCFDKGPSTLRLLEAIHQLYLHGADIELLAGNHDMRTLVGFYYAESTDPKTDHLFVRMGRKTVPLLKEIFDRYIAGTEYDSAIDGSKMGGQLYPDESWYQLFPVVAKSWMTPKVIEKELRRVRQKTQDVKSRLQEEGLNLAQVSACVKKFRELFFEPSGRYYWFFRRMKLAYRQGSYLFVHAGADDVIAAKICAKGKDGINDINDEFRDMLQIDPLKLYYGELGNVFRTKYREVDFDFTERGVDCLHQAGIFAIVHGHRNIRKGQRMVMREGMLNFECDASVNCNTRLTEGLEGQGGAVVIFTEDGCVSGLSTDYPYIKQFNP